MNGKMGQRQSAPGAVARPEAPALASAPSRKASTARVRGKRIYARHSLARDWWMMGPIMALAAIANALFSMTLPPFFAVTCVTVAASAAGSGYWLARRERDLQISPGMRKAILGGTIGLPMLLFGVGLAHWQTGGSAAGQAASLGIMAVVGMLAAIFCSGRLPALVTAQISLWTGLVIVTRSPVVILVLALGAVIGAYATMRQQGADRASQARKEAAERTQQRAELILSDFEQTRQGWFWESDRRGTITYVSATIGEVIGRDPQRLLGRPFSELFILDDHSREGERTLAFHMSTRSSFQELAVRARTADPEEERWWSINGLPVYDDYDNFQGFRGSGSDLTEKRRSEAKVTRLAHYDSLTGLANRLQISQLLEKILTARAEEQRTCAVFMIDLDRFKQVNDTLGHPAGDALLTQVSQRLERAVDRAGRVGRLGGDEFQVIMPGRHTNDALAALAEQVIETISQPYLIDGNRVMIGASVGIALAPDNGVTSEALIRNADLALYAAKDGGRGRHHFYAPDLHSDAEERRQLEQDLRDALASGGLTLAYQPVVSTTTERVTGFEALLRWDHPVRGELSPAKFIPIAEESGLIAQIGEWALRTACMDMARWPGNVRCAVNVSPLQFANPALPSIVTNALAAAQVDPARLELEITESVFLDDGDKTDHMFAALKRIGVRLALDDFGTGYSSLGYLKKAPFDKIKIDQSFVRGATIQGSRNGAIISAIVSLAEALGMETTAEGVETLDELDLVRVLGCSHVQGYIYSKAIGTTAASAILESGLPMMAEGPRSARPVRQTMLRKVQMEHGAQRYEATIRNISPTGAMISGLWNVPPGTVFSLELGEGQVITVTCRWCREDRMGVEFANPLTVDNSGRIELMPERRRPLAADILRKTG